MSGNLILLIGANLLPAQTRLPRHTYKTTTVRTRCRMHSQRNTQSASDSSLTCLLSGIQDVNIVGALDNLVARWGLQGDLVGHDLEAAGSTGLHQANTHLLSAHLAINNTIIQIMYFVLAHRAPTASSDGSIKTRRTCLALALNTAVGLRATRPFLALQIIAACILNVLVEFVFFNGI